MKKLSLPTICFLFTSFFSLSSPLESPDSRPICNQEAISTSSEQTKSGIQFLQQKMINMRDASPVVNHVFLTMSKTKATNRIYQIGDLLIDDGYLESMGKENVVEGSIDIPFENEVRAESFMISNGYLNFAETKISIQFDHVLKQLGMIETTFHKTGDDHLITPQGIPIVVGPIILCLINQERCHMACRNACARGCECSCFVGPCGQPCEYHSYTCLPPDPNPSL